MTCKEVHYETTFGSLIGWANKVSEACYSVMLPSLLGWRAVMRARGQQSGGESWWTSTRSLSFRLEWLVVHLQRCCKVCKYSTIRCFQMFWWNIFITRQCFRRLKGTSWTWGQELKQEGHQFKHGQGSKRSSQLDCSTMGLKASSSAWPQFVWTM